MPHARAAWLRPRTGAHTFLVRESAAAGTDSDRLIVEIGEQRPATDAAAFRRTVCALRDQGIHIAIDDVGSDHSNYRTILDCRPEYLKIDRYFIDGVSNDPARQVVIRSVCDLGSSSAHRSKTTKSCRRWESCFFRDFSMRGPHRMWIGLQDRLKRVPHWLARGSTVGSLIPQDRN